MSYFLFLATFLKNALFIVISEPIAFKSICCILLYFLQRYIRNILNLPRNVSLFTYKIQNFIIPIFCIITYFFVFILLITIYRITNLSRISNLKKVFSDLYAYILITDKITLLLNLFMLLLTLIVLFNLYKMSKSYLIKQFTMLYIYLSQFHIFPVILYHFNRILDIPGDRLYTLLKTQYNYTCKYCDKLIRYFGILLLLILLMYDIVFNNMLISKVYFIIPFTYLYTLVFSFKSFVERRHLINDVSLAKFYYIKHIYEDLDSVYLENGDFYSKEDIQNLQEHILQDFKI